MEITFKGELNTITLSKDDVVVLRTERELSKEQRSNVADVLYATFPNNRVLIVGPGFSLEKWKQEDVPDGV